MDNLTFQWPTDPPEDWWLTSGAELGLSPELIRFCAALFMLGGADSKKNSQAAKLAGMATTDRTQAFPYARSVKVRQMLTEAEKVRSGVRAPITELEIDQRIEDLIRAPDALMVARGIELREKRKASGRAADDDYNADDGFGEWRITRDFLIAHGASAFMLSYAKNRRDLGWPGNYPLLHDVHDLMKSEPFGQQIWDWACSGCSESSREHLAKKLADPNYQLEARKQIWAERGIKVGTNGEAELMAGGFIT